VQIAQAARLEDAVHYRGKLHDLVGAAIRAIDETGRVHLVRGANNYAVKGGEKWCAESDADKKLESLAQRLGSLLVIDAIFGAATDDVDRITSINDLPTDVSEPPSTLHPCVGCREHFDGHPFIQLSTRYVTAGFNDGGEMTALEEHTHPAMMNKWRSTVPPTPSAPPIYSQALGLRPAF